MSISRRQNVLTLSTEGKPLPLVRKAVLALSGLDQTDIATRAGVSRQAVSHVMRGFMRSERVEIAIADATGYPRDALFPDAA